MPILELTQVGRAPHVVRLIDAPVLIGRAPSNDLVVGDDQVSWHHCAVWLESGGIFIRDMGSRNGTLVNGERIRGAHRISDGDVVALGPTTAIRLQEGDHSAPAPTLLLEEIDSGVRFPLRADRFHIGSAPDSDLHIDGAPERAATLLVDDDGEVMLATDDSALGLRPGQVFEVAGCRLRTLHMANTGAPTVEPNGDRYPYSLNVKLNGATGPEASFEDPVANIRYRVEAENRAILLYLLAKKAVSARENGAEDSDAGWATDDEVSVGVWGRGGPSDANNLHVLVYRLRKELKKAGFDPWFIEKRRKALRLRLRNVTVSD